MVDAAQLPQIEALCERLYTSQVWHAWQHLLHHYGNGQSKLICSLCCRTTRSWHRQSRS